jgi:glycosyltransferase involved in cell wall biosynthesis/tetratricopeptide (TPR) repeat protein
MSDRRKEAIRRLRELRQAGDHDSVLAEIAGLTPELGRDSRILLEQGLALRKLGKLDAAHEAFEHAVELEPGLVKGWTELASMLPELGRATEIPLVLARMTGAVPAIPDNLLRAASIAKTERFDELAVSLARRALAAEAVPASRTILESARLLLAVGDEGQAIALLQKAGTHVDAADRAAADDVIRRATARVYASRGSDALPVGAHDRANDIAAGAILAGSEQAQKTYVPKKGHLALVLSGLGARGVQKQAVRLVRGLRATCPSIAHIVLLLLSEQTGAEVNMEQLEGLDVGVESLTAFPAGIGDVTTPELSARIGVLPPRIVSRTAFFIDRLRVHQPEVVLSMSYIYGFDALLAACVVGVPRVILSAHSERPVAGDSRSRLLTRPLQTALASGRISLFANSTAVAESFADWLRVPTTAIRTIYDGVSVDELMSLRDPTLTATYRSKLGIPSGARVVGSIIINRAVKRPKLWVDAAAVIAARAPDVVFVLVGVSEGDDLTPIIDQHGLTARVHRVGMQKNVAAWLDLMDVVLLTSVSETTPNVLLEAQSLGVPVVSTSVGGCAETFVPGITGLLVAANPSPEEVANAVLRVLNDPAYASRAREQGPAFVRERYGIDRMVREYVEVCFEDKPTAR